MMGFTYMGTLASATGLIIRVCEQRVQHSRTELVLGQVGALQMPIF